MAETTSKLGSLSSQMNEFKTTLESYKPKEETHGEAPDLSEYLSKHVPDCPDCQKTITEAGYIKKPEKPAETTTETSEEDRKSFRAGDLFGNRE